MATTANLSFASTLMIYQIWIKIEKIIMSLVCKTHINLFHNVASGNSTIQQKRRTPYTK